MTDQPKRGRGRPRKNILDDAVKIPYERSTSDDPKKQSMIDIMETGRCVTEFTPSGIRRVDPMGPEAAIILHNAEHPEQHTEIRTVSYPKDWDKMSKVDKLK